MAVRKIPLESGGYIKFENDEEYYEWLQKQEELRRQQQEEEEEEERVKTILKVGCFVIVLIFLGVLGLCSSSNKKKEKKVEEIFRTEKREAKTKEQIEQNTYEVSSVQWKKQVFNLIMKSYRNRRLMLLMKLYLMK